MIPRKTGARRATAHPSKGQADPSAPGPAPGAAESSLLFGLFVLLWALPRLGSLAHNVSFGDDYLYFDNPRIVHAFLDEWRPAQWAYHQVMYWIFSPRYMTELSSKVVSGVAVALAGALLARWIHSRGVTRPLAFLTALCFIWHPLLNELTLWGIAGGISFALALAVSGSCLLLSTEANNRQRLLIGSGLLLLSVASYQTYIAIPAVFLGTTLVLDRLALDRWRIRPGVVFGTCVAAVCVVYVLYVALSWKLGWVEPKRLPLDAVDGGILSTKLHGVANILVNVHMPLISYDFGLEAAYRGWKWILPLLCLFTAIAVGWLTRDLVASAAAGALPLALSLLTTIPTLVLNQSPESWRIAVPALLAFLLGAAPLLWVASRSRASIQWTAMAALTAFALWEVRATVFESRQRVLRVEVEQATLEAIREHWQAGEFTVGVALPTPGEHIPLETWNSRHVLTYAYRPYIGPPTAFEREEAWQGFLRRNGLRPNPLCTEQRQRIQDPDLVTGCRTRPSEIIPGSPIRILHDPAGIGQRHSLVCLAAPALEPQ